MKLLVFAGSTRLNSYNRQLARVAANMARAAGAEVSHIELADFDIPLYNADLEAKGDVIACNLIRFNNGERTDAWLYRVSGYIPPAAPGRKARPAK